MNVPYACGLFWIAAINHFQVITKISRRLRSPLALARQGKCSVKLALENASYALS